MMLSPSSSTTQCTGRTNIASRLPQRIGRGIGSTFSACSSIAGISKDFPLAAATDAVLKAVREDIPYRHEGDVWYADDMAAARVLVQKGAVLTACEGVVGIIE